MNDTCEGVAPAASGKDRHEHDGGPDRLCAACRKTMRDADASGASSWELFCGEADNGTFRHFYGSKIQVEMCGEERIAVVRIAVDEAGPYWGWHYSHHPFNGSFKGKVSMIYSNAIGVEICFPYGAAAEMERGRGRIVRLRAELVRRVERKNGTR